jgi:hypothetical protein
MKIRVLQLILCLIATSTLLACAELKDTGRTIGHGTKDIATSIGHAARDTAKSISKNTKKVVAESTQADEK